MYYHSYTTEKLIEYNLYGKGKIPCRLIEYYGSHRPNSSYIYKYKHKLMEVGNE